MRLDKTALCALIPHHGSMCLLDAVESWDESGIACTSLSHLIENHPLRKHGKLHALTGIEYAAQAMAVHGALVAGEVTPRPGYLAALREVTLSKQQLDDISLALHIYATRLAGDTQHLLYAFKICAGSLDILSGRAAVVLNPHDKRGE